MRRQPWLVMSLLALAGVLVLAAFPARAYRDQLHQRKELASRIEMLANENQRLADQAAVLKSDEVIERLARERYQLVKPGEEAFSILPLPEAEPVAAAPAVAEAPKNDGSWWARAWAKLTSAL